ncbi:beta-N-acetylhexosaminidase [Neoasaia chiangmaiensis NBRC 101099]|uniref:beta-N-acetylhexosaminidase n=2 Tax=Neoasaia chiangmaiensis TaxID=320497 RepID=A0A1U9KP01_9PROT|nr:beta-N-acetylhexosaminidase [Neoasaia chiangmaiensis]GBR42369.1 beta-N-acetylhexosaminidase [Neoasaia chiangmaiensis NBRC 101099]GEN14074.1 hypothetical protein NCH01_05050 [Neoasaia chiangmaiensis]
MFLSCAAMALMLGGASPARAAPDLMPMPQSATFDGGGVPLAGGMQVVWDSGKPTPLLKRALARFQTRLNQLTGPSAAGGAPLALHIRVGRDPEYLTVHEHEHYTLNAGADGVTLTANGPAGVLRGLATLLQLVQHTPQGVTLADAHIDDAPRFVWRGLMLDVSRHFVSVETVKRQLDAMELTKLNVLHWHLSDGTGFRVESHRYPKLQEIGGHHQYYTQAQIREIVAYAADRGIRIVPEFDIPGHALSVLQAYPELAAQQPVPLTKEWLKTCQTAFSGGGSTTSCSQHLNLNNPAFDPTRPDVLRFAAGLYAEMGALFPDRYFHSGGDEVVSKQWTTNPKIAAYMKAHGYADAPALQAAFTAEVEKVLAHQGKIMMGWDEVSEAPIPKDVVVEAWRGSKWIGSATRAGHPVVVSSGYYLDLLRPAAEHYAVDPFDVQADGLSPEEGAKARVKAGPMIDAFTLDPNEPPLDDAQKKLVLGGEAPLWSEIVSDEMTDARLWPRSIAIAERYWSPESVRDVADMERRLPTIQAELEATGLEASRNRARMVARMTPDNIEPLTVLTDATVPVQNYAMNRLANNGDEMLDAPGAIAQPDSFSAMAFNRLASRYAAGDLSVAAPLRAMLNVYAANASAYQVVATTPQLQAAIPVSQQLSALALTGLEAMEKGHHNKAWRVKAAQQIAQQQAVFAACATHVASLKSTLPPSGLMIAILPGIEALVNASK